MSWNGSQNAPLTPSFVAENESFCSIFFVRGHEKSILHSFTLIGGINSHCVQMSEVSYQIFDSDVVNKYSNARFNNYTIIIFKSENTVGCHKVHH